MADHGMLSTYRLGYTLWQTQIADTTMDFIIGYTTRFCDRGKYTKKRATLASDLGYVVGLLFYTGIGCIFG